MAQPVAERKWEWGSSEGCLQSLGLHECLGHFHLSGSVLFNKFRNSDVFFSKLHMRVGPGATVASQRPPIEDAIAHGSFRVLQEIASLFWECDRGAHAGQSQCSSGLLNARSCGEHNLTSIRRHQ
eukprot:scaffold111116_cov16-Tisochrysis_lutea.AAC.1